MARKTFRKPLKTAHHQQKAPKDHATTKDRALAALLDSRSVAAAARKAEIGESTLRRWLRDDEDFQDKLRDRRQQALRHAALTLQERSSDAVEALFTSIASDKKVEPGRAALLRTALDFAFRAGSYNDLAERLDALERAAAEEKSNSSGKHRRSQRSESETAGGEDDSDIETAENDSPAIQ
jgi:hypothetical protein